MTRFRDMNHENDEDLDDIDPPDVFEVILGERDDPDECDDDDPDEDPDMPPDDLINYAELT